MVSYYYLTLGDDMKRLTIATFVVLCLSSTAVAEELDTIFKKVNEYVAAQNYPKAIEELQWANKELEKKHNEKLGTLFPQELVGFKGDKLKAQAAMGFSTVEKVYRKGNQKIHVTLTGGSRGQAGGLASIGRMAAMMGGNQPGVETFRVDGRTANLNVQEGRSRAELSVFLESGDILKLELKNTKEAQADTLKSALEQIQIGALDTYLKGAS